MKNILKKFLIGTFVALALMVASSALASYDFGPTTLKVGSTGQYVMTLQTLVGATPVDGSFGPITKAKVVAWQNAHGLIADGLFGPISKAKANETGTNFSAGCTNASGFSITTGLACSSLNANTFSPGCSNASGFSITTGLACSSLNANTFPTGCTNASGFSITTGLACSSLNANTFSAGCTNASGFSITTGYSCSTGIPATTTPIIRSGGSSGGHHATESSDASLNIVTSTIKGETIDSLGTPNAVLASIALAGATIISTTQAADTDGTGLFVTSFDSTNIEVTATKFVKYATGASTANFTADTDYNNEAITDQDFFIVKLTAGDSSVLYYKIVVTVLVPTANVTFALTTPEVGGGNAITVVQTPGAKTIAIAVVNTTASVVITGTKTTAQTVAVSGANSGNVIQTNGTTTAPIFTVNTSSVAAGGEKDFTLTVSQPNKTDIVYTVTVTVAEPGPVEITAFDAISDVAGGTTEVRTYANAAAVIADLNVSKATVTANTSAVTVPVTTWVDTDIYNSESVGSYTFTATLGTIPEGFLNTGNHTATVEVVVGAPLTPVITNAYTTVAANHIVTITLTGGTFKTGVIDTTDFTFTGTGNDWNAIAAATTFTRTNDTVVTITGIDGLLGAVDNIVAVLGEAQAIQADSVTAVASTPTDVTDASFTTVTGDNNVTVTLTGGTFKADPIDAADFIFTGDDELALEGATTFTRTSPTIVTITGLSALGGTNNTVTVLGEAQATQATSVAGASSLLLTNVTSDSYTTVTGNNDILITLTGGGTFKAGEIDQQDFYFAGAADWSVIAAATSFTRASDTEVIIAGIGPLTGFATNTITVMGATMAIQATGVTVVASTVNEYALRDIGPAGGWIVTRNGTSNNYLESAPANFHPGTKRWSNTADNLATSNDMGTGQANTNTILASLGEQTSTATQFCAGLEIGANDWFLPSLDELSLMYTNLQVEGIGGFRGSNASYWSSSQFNISNASVVDFTSGIPGNYDKSSNTGPYTRCVRAFHADKSIGAPITATFAHNVAGDPIITVTALRNGAGVNMLGDFITDNGTDFSYTLTNGGTPATVTKVGGSANLTIATPADASDAGAYTLTIIRVNGGVGKWAIAVIVADDLQTVDPANGSTVSATTPASPTHAVEFTYTVTVKDNTTAHAFVSGLTAGNFSEAAFNTGTQTPVSGNWNEVSVVEVTSGVYTITATYDTIHAGMDIETTVLGVKITDEVVSVVVQ